MWQAMFYDHNWNAKHLNNKIMHNLNPIDSFYYRISHLWLHSKSKEGNKFASFFHILYSYSAKESLMKRNRFLYYFCEFFCCLFCHSSAMNVAHFSPIKIAHSTEHCAHLKQKKHRRQTVWNGKTSSEL